MRNQRLHIMAHRVGSLTILPTHISTYKKKEDKVPFDAVCLTCENPTCKGECSRVGGKDKMDKKEKAAKARVRFGRQMGELTVGSDSNNITKITKNVK